MRSIQSVTPTTPRSAKPASNSRRPAITTDCATASRIVISRTQCCKRVLIGADGFPSNHFLMTKPANRTGFALHTVPFRQGAAKWGPDMGRALLTWMSSNTSHRITLDSLVVQRRAVGSLIGVDIT